jgi:hypothetical protein
MACQDYKVFMDATVSLDELFERDLSWALKYTMQSPRPRPFQKPCY